MEPVALINQNICLLYQGTKKYRRVTYLEPIPPFQCLDLGAIAAQTVTARTRAPNLDLWDGEIGQYRWFPLDNAQVRLFLPQADGRYLLRQMQVPVDAMITQFDPCLHLTEFFVWEDKSPWFEAINFQDYALAACRIIAMGFRFVTTELGRDVINKIETRQEGCVYIVGTGSAGAAK